MGRGGQDGLRRSAAPIWAHGPGLSLTTSVVSSAVGAEFRVWHPSSQGGPSQAARVLCLGLSALSQGLLDEVFGSGMWLSYLYNILGGPHGLSVSSVFWSRFRSIWKKGYRVCGLELWWFLVSIKVKETYFPYIQIFVLLSLVDFERRVEFKCSMPSFLPGN